MADPSDLSETTSDLEPQTSGLGKVHVTHPRPYRGGLGSARYGHPVPPKVFTLHLSAHAVDVEFLSNLRELATQHPSLTYVVIEYNGCRSKLASMTIGRAVTIIESSRLFTGVGGRLTPVMSLRDTSWEGETPYLPPGWLLAEHLLESGLINPGWAGGDSRRFLTPPVHQGRRYVIVWGYLGEGMGAYPPEVLSRIADSIVSSGTTEVVFDWRVSAQVSLPLPAVNVGGFVVQPVIGRDTTPQSWVDGKILVDAIEKLGSEKLSLSAKPVVDRR